jgi:dihydropyrimidinase
MTTFDLVVKGGTVATAADVFTADIGVTAGRIAALGHALAGAGYTPFEGLAVQGWPVHVLRRGETVVQDGEVVAAPGSGRFLPRRGGEAAHPSGRPVAEMDAGRNFGAELL